MAKPVKGQKQSKGTLLRNNGQTILVRKSK